MTTQISGDTGVSAVQSGVVQQADLAANVVGNGPAFSAYQTAVSAIPSGTATKVTFDTTEWNPSGGYNASLSKFQPSVAGYYRISATIYTEGGGATAGTVYAAIRLNGAEAKRGPRLYYPASAFLGAFVDSIVYLNGSTDYVEIYVTQASGSSVNTQAGGSLTTFCGELVRAA